MYRTLNIGNGLVKDFCSHIYGRHIFYQAIANIQPLTDEAKYAVTGFITCAVL